MLEHAAGEGAALRCQWPQCGAGEVLTATFTSAGASYLLGLCEEHMAFYDRAVARYADFAGLAAAEAPPDQVERDVEPVEPPGPSAQEVQQAHVVDLLGAYRVDWVPSHPTPPATGRSVNVGRT